MNILSSEAIALLLFIGVRKLSTIGELLWLFYIQFVKMLHPLWMQMTQNEFFKYFPQLTIDKAIATTPAQAGITPQQLEKIANEVIKYERIQVSGISVALGVPGGWAVAATVPADIIQYYGYTLRATQKLLWQHRIIPHKCKQGAHNEHIAEGNPSISFAMAH